MYFCIIDTKYQLLLGFMMQYSIKKDWNIFLKFLDEVPPLELKTILSWKLERVKIIEVPPKVGYFYKNGV